MLTLLGLKNKLLAGSQPRRLIGWTCIALSVSATSAPLCREAGAKSVGDGHARGSCYIRLHSPPRLATPQGGKESYVCLPFVAPGTVGLGGRIERVLGETCDAEGAWRRLEALRLCHVTWIPPPSRCPCFDAGFAPAAMPGRGH